MSNSVENYKRFNRHEVFTQEDTSLVMKLIKEVGKYREDGIDNKLFGLFDGYWYNGLVKELYSKTSVASDLVSRLEGILQKVEVHINEDVWESNSTYCS